MSVKTEATPPTAPPAPVTEAHELRDLISKLLHRNEPITASKAIQAAFDLISAAATAKALEAAAKLCEELYEGERGVWIGVDEAAEAIRALINQQGKPE